MDKGDKVTLSDDVPEPEMWTKSNENNYFYEHKESGNRINTEAYQAMKVERKILAEFLEEVDKPK